MLTTRHGVRVLAAADLDEFLALANQDPVVNVFAIHRAQTTSLEPRWLGGEMWGRFDGGRLVAACHVAANLVPVQAGPEGTVAFAERALARRRTASTIVGPQDAVVPFWDCVRETWGRPRDARWDQRHLVIDGSPQVAPDPEVRARRHGPTSTPSIPPAWRCTPKRSGVLPEIGGGSELYRTRALAADQPRVVLRPLRPR